MPSPLLSQNYRELFLDLFIEPHLRAITESEYHAEELEKVIKPSVLSAFEWPTTRPLPMPSRKTSSMYVLLPQGFDYKHDNGEAKAMWGGLQALRRRNLPGNMHVTKLDYYTTAIPWQHAYCIPRKAAICSFSVFHTATPLLLYLEPLAAVMGSVQVFVFDFNDPQGGGYTFLGPCPFVKEIHSCFSRFACLKVFVSQWKKWAKQKTMFKSALHEMMALPPIDHPPFPGGHLYHTSMASFNSYCDDCHADKEPILVL